MAQDGPVIGLIVADYGQHYWVEPVASSPTEPAERILCSAPRSLRSKLLVGDQVEFQITGSDSGQILRIQPRRSVLYRQDQVRTKAFAANLDQLIWVMAAEPVFSEEQLTRTLLAAEAAGIQVQLVLNKSDLPQAFAAAKARLEPYVRMGYPLTCVSCLAEPEAARAALWPLCQNQASLVLGASGVGKTSLTNLFLPAEQKALTQGLSSALRAGKHTTTATHWYWLDDAHESALIDSPGFQIFGLSHLKAEQLADLMLDLAPFAHECQFHNCTHRKEPNCAVKDQLDKSISVNRYSLYCALFEELDMAHRSAY